MPLTNRDYLGDGVYVGLDEAGQIVLTAHMDHVDGTEKQNTIYLEPDVLQSLVRYAKRMGLNAG